MFILFNLKLYFFGIGDNNYWTCVIADNVGDVELLLMDGLSVSSLLPLFLFTDLFVCEKTKKS